MNSITLFRVSICLGFFLGVLYTLQQAQPLTLNEKADGYLGIWYQNQPLDNIYKFKYSGGLGTYCAKHKPFAVYSKEANKTFFCFGGVKKGYHEENELTRGGIGGDSTQNALYHMVAYYDHETGMVPRPTIVLDKQTYDAHDNPVISMDDEGYIWIFSTSHGTMRPSYIHRSKQPYDVSEFERIMPTYQVNRNPIPLDNFSYMQTWYVSGQGFVCFLTKYNQPAKRTNYFMHSGDGISWSEMTCLAAIEEGHYQISAVNETVAGTAFNYHPEGQGVNWRTNLYYMETRDMGRTWQAVDGTPLKLPLTDPQNAALIYDFEADDLKVYLKDIRYDTQNRPIVLFLTSRGYKSGPESDPRIWNLAHWTDNQWKIRPLTTSDNNYDMGSLWLVSEDQWQIVAPTETGPQPYNPGGEIAMWESYDLGQHWQRMKVLTSNSTYNHTYVRQPVNAHPDFWALWADGNGREPSESRIYFCNQQGEVFRLPVEMRAEMGRPEKVD